MRRASCPGNRQRTTPTATGSVSRLTDRKRGDRLRFPPANFREGRKGPAESRPGNPVRIPAGVRPLSRRARCSTATDEVRASPDL
jgi:hypothetical protein